MKAKVSNASVWSEQEKLQVLFSVVDGCKPINWDKVVIPEGRSKKAVMCMLDGLKKHAHGGTPSATSSPAKARASNGKGTKRKRTTKKSQEEEMVDDEEVETCTVNKKLKVESQDEEDNEVAKEKSCTTKVDEKFDTGADTEDGEEV